jgi:hypothetical protein
MADSFEDDMKELAMRWANCGGSHSDDVVEEMFGVILRHFPNWSPDDEETQHYINFVKR